MNKYDIKGDKKNRELFSRYLSEHKAPPSGVPAFFVGDKAIIGFVEGRTPAEITAALDALSGKTIESQKSRHGAAQ